MDPRWILIIFWEGSKFKPFWRYYEKRRFGIELLHLTNFTPLLIEITKRHIVKITLKKYKFGEEDRKRQKSRKFEILSKIEFSWSNDHSNKMVLNN